MKSCPACGNENTDDVQYCEDCGRELPAEVETATDVADVALESAEITDVEHEAAAETMAEDAVSEEDAVVVYETQDSAEEFTDEVEAFEEDSEGHAGEARIIEPHLVVVSTGEKILLTEQEAIIGREDPISSIFPDIDTTPFGGLEGGVSRKHARVYEKDGSYYIEDLNSTNYTLINKQKVDPSSSQPLAAGDEIRLGRVALLFTL
ncbi:MAG: FHA domain-containing protein [Gemmatimonadota bacterium]|nr:FHA domain-containing protein [Gemmatimonadota bacterium]